MGQLGVPEAVPYLDGFALADFDEPDGPQIFVAARYALYDTLVAQLSTDEDKAAYYQDRLRENFGLGASWAANRVCNTGLLAALPAVRQYLIKRDNSRGEANARFCESRIRALAADPNRLNALATVLQISAEPSDPRLMQWAARELMTMKAPEADAELERFEREALALPEDHPQYQFLIGLADEIWAHFGFPDDRRYYPNGKRRGMLII